MIRFIESIALKPDAEPILRPRKQLPIELKDSVKQERDRLVKAGVLAPLDEPTERMVAHLSSWTHII